MRRVAGCSTSVRFHRFLLLQLCLLLDVLFLFVLFSIGLPQFSSYIRLFQRASLKEKLSNLDLSFPVCKVKIFSYRPLLSKEVLMELRECDTSLKQKAKAKIIWNARLEETGFQEFMLAVVLMNIAAIRGLCVFPLTLVESEPQLVCSTSWLCKPLSRILRLFLLLFPHT